MTKIQEGKRLEWFRSSLATLNQKSKRISRRWPMSWVNWENQQSKHQGQSIPGRGKNNYKGLKAGRDKCAKNHEQQEPLRLECRERGLRGLGKDSGFYAKWVEGYKQNCDKFWTWYLKDHSGWSVGEERFLKVLSQLQMSNFFPVILGSHKLVAWARKRMYSPH